MILACICGGIGEVALVAALASSPIVIGCISCVKKHLIKKDECECECHEEE